jgi:ABC-type Fe3+/spermidine/putrescine transport system ATPase subunit
VIFEPENRIALQQLEAAVREDMRAPNGVNPSTLQNIRKKVGNETVLLTHEVWEAVTWWTVAALKDTQNKKRSRVGTTTYSIAFAGPTAWIAGRSSSG